MPYGFSYVKSRASMLTKTLSDFDSSEIGKSLKTANKLTGADYSPERVAKL
jgi:hypothetical protein